MYIGPSQNKSILLSLEDAHRKTYEQHSDIGREEAQKPYKFPPCEVFETTVLLVSSARVPHHTWFTYNPLTAPETNISRW